MHSNPVFYFSLSSISPQPSLSVEEEDKKKDEKKENIFSYAHGPLSSSQDSPLVSLKGSVKRKSYHPKHIKELVNPVLEKTSIFLNNKDNIFKQDQIKAFEALKTRYPLLFLPNFIKACNFPFPPMPDIEMDKIFICSLQDFKFIGTSGVATCHIVCGKGKTKEGQIFLALAHMTLSSPTFVVQTMQRMLLEQGCVLSTLAFYLFGGSLPTKQEEDNMSLDIQAEFLKLSENYPIKEVNFNVLTAEEMDDNENYGVAFGVEGLFFKKDALFPLLPVEEVDLLSLSDE